MHFAVLGFTLGSESEAGFVLWPATRGQLGSQAADLWTMFEAMTRSSADQHDIGHRRMSIDQEIAVRAVLILADFRPDDRRALQQGKSAVAEGDDFVERGPGRLA